MVLATCDSRTEQRRFTCYYSAIHPTHNEGKGEEEVGRVYRQSLVVVSVSWAVFCSDAGYRERIATGIGNELGLATNSAVFAHGGFDPAL